MRRALLRAEDQPAAVHHQGHPVTPLEQGVTNVDGYEVSYSDASVITHYAVLVSAAGLADIEREYKELRKAIAASLKRPDRLRGLSPWREAPVRPTAADAWRSRALAAPVRAAIDAMDARGAWVEEGTIGKANRLVSVLAGKIWS